MVLSGKSKAAKKKYNEQQKIGLGMSLSILTGCTASPPPPNPQVSIC